VQIRSIKLFVIVTGFLAILPIASCRKPQSGGLKFVGQNGSTRKLQKKDCLVVATHGWIEKAAGDWPQEMAEAIQERVDDSTWLCGYFDWSGGAKTINPTDAAKYARDIAGPKLAEQILETQTDWRHIHLIGHSCGCWVISEAAKILAKKTFADIHLTFLDAYVPAFWHENALGDVNTAADVNFRAEQYFTRDLTLQWTQNKLTHAHNVDITDIDSIFKDHNFPWQWYLATAAGKYSKHNLLHKGTASTTANGIEYGFALSREAAGKQAWLQNLKLPVDNEPVKIRKHKKGHIKNRI